MEIQGFEEEVIQEIVALEEVENEIVSVSEGDSCSLAKVTMRGEEEILITFDGSWEMNARVALLRFCTIDLALLCSSCILELMLVGRSNEFLDWNFFEKEHGQDVEVLLRSKSDGALGI
ncbi:hypothetical protein V6N13_091580 [Hibiscus sabdariffa]